MLWSFDSICGNTFYSPNPLHDFFNFRIPHSQFRILEALNPSALDIPPARF